MENDKTIFKKNEIVIASQLLLNKVVPIVSGIFKYYIMKKYNV
jgi:hypothetical protein